MGKTKEKRSQKKDRMLAPIRSDVTTAVFRGEGMGSDVTEAGSSESIK